MLKKILYTLLIISFVTACGSMDSVKRGLTGGKEKSTDEFFIKKKDPLILPPDYGNLPTPDEKIIASEEKFIFEEIVENSSEDNTSASGSVENSILRKIRSK